ncbi:MAG: DUF542 domain-containing protein [Gemmatimonadota bacterium]
MSSIQTGFDPGVSVNQVIREHPGTVEVFNRFGIDSCCGGAAGMRDAALRDGADPEALLAAVRSAIEAAS